jgi:uncharacterized damage-inducible protein DinB
MRDDVLVAGEGDTLRAFVRFHQDALLRKVEGLSEEDLRRAMVPSGTSLLGILKHETHMLHRWFHMRFAGDQPELPREREWVIEPGERSEDLIARYRAEVERSRRIMDSADPDAPSKGLGPRGDGKPGDFTLRWILVHVIEEMARHNGHADILREQLDGATGE